jgi:uncharacterized protein
LGVCYQNGTGVNVDMKKAVELYKLSADQGNATGQYCLGVCYKYGTGVDLDMKKSVELFKLSADQGNEYSINQLKSLK